MSNTAFTKVKSISLDPGITTGISYGLVLEDTFYIGCAQERVSENQLYELLEEWMPKHIVFETFEKRMNKQAVELFSRNLIGIVNFFGARNKSVILNPQTPGYGKGHFTDSKLKKMNVYIPGKEHGRDALRHHLQWWMFSEGFQYNRKHKILLSRTETIMEKAGV